MKHLILLTASLPFIASCSVFDGMVSRNITDSELPGIPTQINCNPEPTLIYSKAGDLIETIHPILHPTCGAQSSIGAVKGETATNWWSMFGPATNRASSLPTEATDDDQIGNVIPLNVASDDNPAPVPTPSLAISTPGAPADSPTPTNGAATPNQPNDPVVTDEPVDQEEPNPPSETKADCDGASHCEPDSKTDPEQHRRWREAVKRNAAAAAEDG